MRLLIIASDSSGGVTLASPRVFPDAVEATSELARLFGEGSVDASASFYTVDLDAAVPVIILQHPAAETSAAAVEEPVEEPYASEVLEEIEDPAPVEAPPVVVLAEEPADKATAEDAPAAAAPAEAEEELAAGAQWPWDLPVIPEEGSADEVVETPAEEALETPTEPEPRADEVEPVALGDLDLEAAVAEDAPEEPETEPVETPADFVAFEPEAVTDVDAEEPVAVADAPEDDPVTSLLAEALAAEEAPAEEVPAEPAEEPVPVEDEVAVVVEPQSVLDASVGAETAQPASELAYEPGALNMNEYTCADCVYVNTCPNHDQKKPAECGSFQWKSM